MPCVTCWRYSLHWVQKQVEALAKQDRFQCWPASKTMNAQSHQKPYGSHARSDPPPKKMDRSRSMSADYKIATEPFLFCLNKAVVLNNFSLLRFHSRLKCVSMVQWSIQLLLFVLFCSCFVFLAHPNQIVCIIVHFKWRNQRNSWEKH